MSLITTASPWNANESTNKRVSTLRKTIKKTAGINDSIPDYSTHQNHIQGSVYNESPAEKILPPNDSTEKPSFGVFSPDNNRSEKVLELIHNLTPDNDGHHLANFNPPSSQKPVQPAAASAVSGQGADAPIAPLPNEFQLSSPSNQFGSSSSSSSSGSGGGARFSPNPSRTGDFSNYLQSYGSSPSLNQGKNRYLASLASGLEDGSNSKLMDKINYMIHMLEQQQNERTDHLMEEFILYTLLGVFIIFVVDGFARSGSGKYVR